MRTRICELLGIELPVIQAGMSIFTSAELVCAVSNAGGLGASAAGGGRPKRPFAINHVVPALDEAVFALSLEARPALISLALGDPGELVRRIHGAGIKAMQQVTTVAQARQAAERGVDIIVAQGIDDLRQPRLRHRPAQPALALHRRLGRSQGRGAPPGRATARRAGRAPQGRSSAASSTRRSPS